MPSDRFSSARLLRSVAVASALACSAVGSAVLPVAVASADELAGTTVVGELVQVWAESEHEDATDAMDAAEGPLSFVETSSGESVRVPTEGVAGLPAGGTVSVTVGARVDDGAADEHGVEAARTVLASDLLAAPVEPAVVAPNRSLTNEVTVVLVTPAGAPKDGTSLADVVGTVDGAVADFWAEQTSGAITVGVTAAHDWTPTSMGCADPTALWAEAATAVGFVPGDGKHLLLYVTGAAPDCGYALAQVGSAPASGGRLYVRDTSASLIAHELGHNFGLGHSSARQCDTSVEGGDCRTAAYRDLYDVMGVSWGQLGSLNAAQSARLGVLADGGVRSLSVQSGTTAVTLAPLAGRSGTRAVRLTDAEGVDYWLEYRTPTARDAWLSTGNPFRLEAGVLVRQAGKNLPDTSLLLDGTPSAAAGWDADLQAALPVGVPVPLSGGDFTVVLQSVGPDGAVLDVTAAASSAAAPAPAASATAGGGEVLPPVTEEPPVMAAAPAPSAPEHRAVDTLQSTHELEPAGATSPVGVLVALASVLVGAAGLVVLRIRGRIARPC